MGEEVKTDGAVDGEKCKSFIVSFCHGIIEDGGKYYDVCYTIVRDLTSGKDATNWGERVQVPEDLVNIIKEQKQQITIGSLLKKEFGYPSGSWHIFLSTQERWI